MQNKASAVPFSCLLNPKCVDCMCVDAVLFLLFFDMMCLDSWRFVGYNYAFVRPRFDLYSSLLEY